MDEWERPQYPRFSGPGSLERPARTLLEDESYGDY